MVHRLAGDVVAKGDQFMQDPRLEGDPEFRRAPLDEATLEGGRDADVEEVVFRRGKGLARFRVPSATTSCCRYVPVYASRSALGSSEK